MDLRQIKTKLKFRSTLNALKLQLPSSSKPRRRKHRRRRTFSDHLKRTKKVTVSSPLSDSSMSNVDILTKFTTHRHRTRQFVLLEAKKQKTTKLRKVHNRFTLVDDWSVQFLYLYILASVNVFVYLFWCHGVPRFLQWCFSVWLNNRCVYFFLFDL